MGNIYAALSTQTRIFMVVVVRKCKRLVTIIGSYMKCCCFSIKQCCNLWSTIHFTAGYLCLHDHAAALV